MRLTSWHQLMVFAVLAGLLASGVVWLVFQFLGEPEVMGMHPAQAWSLRIHGGLAMLALVVVGSLLPHHALAAWRTGRNRLSGGTMLALLALLALSGWLLYYAGSPALRDAASLCHWLMGLATPLLLAWHWRQRRREKG
ncbi:DUF4405 domain-containing protein [Roseateles sp. NT4]